MIIQIIMIPYISMVYFEDVHSLHYISIFSSFTSFFQTVFSGLHYAVFICVYVVYFNSLHSSVSIPFSLPLPLIPQTVYHAHPCPIIIIVNNIILGLVSKNGLKHATVVLLSLAYLAQLVISSSINFF
jgi:hypothetical protein